MALIMRDSDNPFDIPLDGLAAVAGYGDGAAMWSSQGWARFRAPIVALSIVISASDGGDILDVEHGAADPSQCPGWADRFHRAGRRRPTLYCNRSTIEAVRRAMGSRPFDWWAATLDGTRFLPGAVAVQYCGAADSNDPCRTGGHYDESVILDPAWIGRESAGAQPTPTDPGQHWWGPYVSGADLVVELDSHCHAAVISAAGHWYRNTTSIATPQLGEFAQWVLANRIGGVWYVMDEAGGPQGQGPAGRLPADQSFWIEDSVTDSTGCGGVDPVAVAASGKGRCYSLQRPVSKLGSAPDLPL